jgi:hypothetical protein
LFTIKSQPFMVPVATLSPLNWSYWVLIYAH